MDSSHHFYVGSTRLGNMRAFTLPELMIATSIFSLVSAGVLVGHLFGMRLMEVTMPKLGLIRITSVSRTINGRYPFAKILTGVGV